MLFNYVMYFIYLILSVSGLSYLFLGKNIKISKGLLLVILLLFSFFCVCSVITPDWNSYKDMVSELYKTNGKSVTNMEDIWKRASVFVGGNIILFRMLIFFPSFFFLHRLICILLNEEQYLRFLSLFVVLMLYEISGGRQILAVLIFYYALFSSKKILSLVLIVLSIFCHKIVIMLLIQYVISKIITKKYGIVLFAIISIVVLSNIDYIIGFVLHFPLEDWGFDFYKYYLSDEMLLGEDLPGARRWIYSSYVFTLFTILLVLFVVKRLSKISLSHRYVLIYYFLISFLFIFSIMCIAGYSEVAKLRFCAVQQLLLIFIISYYWRFFEKKIIFVYFILFIYFLFVNIYISGCL